MLILKPKNQFDNFFKIQKRFYIWNKLRVQNFVDNIVLIRQEKEDSVGYK